MEATMDDASLVHRFLNGDAEALGALYDNHAPAIFGYLCRRIGPQDAEDVIQETFVQAARSLRSYDHRGRLRQWLLTIARSRALDRIRKHSRQRERALLEGEEEEISHGARSPLEQQCDRELGERIDAAVQSLPERQREVFLLRQEAGLGFKEIAAMLDMPLNTALSHMHRAVKALRTALADLDAAPEGEIDL